MNAANGMANSKEVLGPEQETGSNTPIAPANCKSSPTAPASRSGGKGSTRQPEPPGDQRCLLETGFLLRPRPRALGPGRSRASLQDPWHHPPPSLGALAVGGKDSARGAHSRIFPRSPAPLPCLQQRPQPHLVLTGPARPVGEQPPFRRGPGPPHKARYGWKQRKGIGHDQGACPQGPRHPPRSAEGLSPQAGW